MRAEAELAVRVFETPWGAAAVAATARGIVRVVLPGRRGRPEREALAARASADPPPKARAYCRRAEREIREYLGGRRRRFSVPLDLRAVPDFQRQVLLAAQRIGYGRTRSYGALASRLGRPRAARAVGQAMARNPVPLLVPCHRVVASDGGLGGFGGGLRLKRRLLALERRMAKRLGNGIPRK